MHSLGRGWVGAESVQLGNSGVGNDWMYLGTFPNSETGLTAYEAQGDAYQLTTEEPPVGRYTQMIGYGTTSPRNERSQAQQFSYGCEFSPPPCSLPWPTKARRASGEQSGRSETATSSAAASASASALHLQRKERTKMCRETGGGGHEQWR